MLWHEGRRRTTKPVVTSVKLTLVIDIFARDIEDVNRMVKRIIGLPGIIAIEKRHEGAMLGSLRGNANVPPNSSETIPVVSLQRGQNGMDDMDLSEQRRDGKRPAAVLYLRRSGSYRQRYEGWRRRHRLDRCRFLDALRDDWTRPKYYQHGEKKADG